jgi:hypothetical protein
MISPANIPVVFAQVSEVTGVADGLQKNPVTYVAAILMFVVLFLYREVRSEQALRIADSKEHAADIKAHEAEIKSLIRETIPLTLKVTEAVGELGRIADRLTKED